MKNTMTKFFFMIFLAMSLIACKNDVKNDESDSLDQENLNEVGMDIPIYHGEFIYVADGAVLKGNNFIYGVTLDEMAQELANKVAPIKQDEFDMVPVSVRGIVSPKPEGSEGWDEVITIKEIVRVSTKPAPADIKIEDKNS